MFIYEAFDGITFHDGTYSLTKYIDERNFAPKRTYLRLSIERPALIFSNGVFAKILVQNYV